MASAIKNPPRNKKMNFEAYGAATSGNGITFKSGNSTSGSNAVTANGIASVIHQQAISVPTAATVRASRESSSEPEGNSR